KNLSQNVVHSDSDLILHNSSVLIDKEPKKLSTIIHKDNSAKLFKIILSDKKKKILKKYLP
ncbi:TPA: hypothetical protein ACGVBL_002818, partial [Enterococcus faecium]